jgi:molybdate transport system substrate-binding protein
MTPSNLRPGRISFTFLAFLASAVVLAALVGLLAWNSRGGRPLLVYCAAGVRPPVEKIAQEYQREYGVEVQLQYGGSQTLLANAEASHQGDLYLPADDSYIETARAKGLVRETFPLARMQAVLAVAKGNPKNLHSLDDLLRDGVRLAHANPDVAAIGKITTEALTKQGRWAALAKQVVVNKPTVTDVANDVAVGSVDAGIVWDVVVKNNDKLEAIPIPEFAGLTGNIAVAVLESSGQRAAALRFARYLAAKDRGLLVFQEGGYEPADGEPWAETPASETAGSGKRGGAK